MALVTRPVTVIAVLLACGLLGACGGDGSDDRDAEAARARQQEAASREREQRMARLERRLAMLKQGERAERDRNSPGSELVPAFDRLEASLSGSAGATLGPPGLATVEPLGRLPTGLAWSTIKLPIALRVLEERGGPRGLSASERGAIERALTASDNGAAALLFRSLGDTQTAATSVEQVLQEAGDTTTRVSTVGRDGFSPYGQTLWALVAQHQFMAALAGGCLGSPGSRSFLLDLMGRVTSDTWGLGSVGLPARWKGGWGPGTDGRYLARQMGVVRVRGRDLVATLAVLPSDGSFASAQIMATAVARWLVERGAPFAGPARC